MGEAGPKEKIAKILLRLGPNRILFEPLGSFVKPEHRDALHSWRNRDEDTFEASNQGACSLLTAAHCPLGEGREVPEKGQPGPEPCWLVGE